MARSASSNCSVLLWLLLAIVTKPVAVFSQSQSQLVEGARKEGSLVLSWGTGTMGGMA